MIVTLPPFPVPVTDWALILADEDVNIAPALAPALAPWPPKATSVTLPALPFAAVLSVKIDIGLPLVVPFPVKSIKPPVAEPPVTFTGFVVNVVFGAKAAPAIRVTLPPLPELLDVSIVAELVPFVVIFVFAMIVKG